MYRAGPQAATKALDEFDPEGYAEVPTNEPEGVAMRPPFRFNMDALLSPAGQR